MKNYIFGYGSLIERESRLRTTPDAKEAYPVEIDGFVRGWWARTGAIGFTTTFLGCIQPGKKIKTKFTSNKVNGVVYAVTEKELEDTNKREQGYTPTKVNHKAIRDYAKVLNSDDIVWVYLNDFRNEKALLKSLPDKNNPIVQSYVDICVNGCLEIEAEFPEAKKDGFAVNFIRSTQEWSGHWANDRLYPRRPFIYCPNSSQIDTLLAKNLPDPKMFDKIYIE